MLESWDSDPAHLHQRERHHYVWEVEKIYIRKLYMSQQHSASINDEHRWYHIETRWR